MTRIIKFRVWNGEKMYDDFLVNFPTIGINSLLADMAENAGVLMQFTGLYDKNGKEIYQSDRLKTESGECEVVWYEQGACFRYKFGENFESPLNYDDVEVIGNIYENETLI